MSAEPDRTRSARSRTPTGRPPGRPSTAKGYVRGQFDRLLPVKDHSSPEELKGVTLEISASGLSVIATELCVDGRTPKRLVSVYPYFVDIAMPDGRSVAIEVRMIEVEAAEEEQPARRGRRGGRSVRARSGPRPGSLSEFGDDDRAYDEHGDCR